MQFDFQLIKIPVVVKCQLAREVYGQVPEVAFFVMARPVFYALDGR